MNQSKFNFKLVLISLLIYELAMLVLSLTGVSFLKLALTGLVWVCFIISFYEYCLYQNQFRRLIPSFAYVVLTALVSWNIFNVLRSIINRDGPLTTQLGNVAGSLAFLIPFMIIFSLYLVNLKVLHKYFYTVLKIGFVAFFGFLLVKGRNLTGSQMAGLLLLFSPVPFLITGLPLQSKRNILFICLCALGLLVSAYLFSGRTALIRVVLLVICLLGVIMYYKFRLKWILPVSSVVLLIPFVLLQQSYVTGESAFETYLNSTTDGDLSVDTRTFLYQEVFADLVTNNKLLIGKGANGSYYSDYFYSIDLGETHNRNNVEVGILGVLLKGGLIAVFLYLLLLLITIFFTFYKSNNIYAIGIGYILMVHILLLFIENYAIYSSYNLFLWFFIGVGLSNKFRSLSNKQIRKLIIA